MTPGSMKPCTAPEDSSYTDGIGTWLLCLAHYNEIVQLQVDHPVFHTTPATNPRYRFVYERVGEASCAQP